MRDRQTMPTTVRCAIYTRKSTDEGLEQEFNSLDAQREACAAYILSQRHEGWILVPDFYDDGGFSGGNMERPGLKQLLADTAFGRIDVIVVYKVDRLTRSLADFSKIVDVLEKGKASFVSVTQAFNTTTSMGRLMLNVLLSFAQFEREVTGERIRDKVAASKKKGMWMGGPVPLGYRLEDRKLVPDPIESETIRHVFARYIALGSGRQLVAELDAQGIRSKVRTTRFGRRYGDRPISRGALYAILQNRLYVGEVVHRNERYAGQHEAIVPLEDFDRVQKMLSTGRVERRLGTNARHSSLLAGLMWDKHGRRMSPSHATKQARRYRYYVSQTDGDAARSVQPWRVCAADIEMLIATRLGDAISSAVDNRIAGGDLDPTAIEILRAKASDAREQLRTPHTAQARSLALQTISRIELGDASINLQISLHQLVDLLGQSEPDSIALPIGTVRTARSVKLLIAPANASSQAPNPALLKLVAQAFEARAAMDAGGSFDEVANRLSYGREYLADLIRTSYLAPSIITAIVEGRQPAGLTRKSIVHTNRIPLPWNEQAQLFGM